LPSFLFLLTANFSSFSSTFLTHSFEVFACVSSQTFLLHFDNKFPKTKFWISFDNFIKLSLWTVIKSGKFLFSHLVGLLLKFFLGNVSLRGIKLD